MKNRKYPHYLPKGWTVEDVQKIIEYYDRQTEEEGVEEIERMFAAEEAVIMEIPRPLVAKVKEMVAKHNAKVAKNPKFRSRRHAAIR